MFRFSATHAAGAALCLALLGCGGEPPEASSSAAAAEEVDPCSLLTAAEIQAVTGIAPEASERPDPRINSCQWPAPGDVVPVVYVGLSYGSSHTWEEYRQYMIENDYGDPEDGGERVDIGRYGHYTPETAMLQVNTASGVLITLRVRDGEKAQLIDLAGKAMARLP